jgi:hypothetical protein
MMAPAGCTLDIDGLSSVQEARNLTHGGGACNFKGAWR